MEVKTFKCDICGEVYHVAEEHNESVTMNVYGGTYNHLCPKCQGYIKAYITKPEIAEEARKARRAVSRLENCLSRIGHQFFPIRSFWYGEGIDIPEYYDSYTDTVMDEIDELKDYKERSRKQMIVIRVLGCLLGMCIGAALAQLI